jgi:hypothetical protein
MLHPLATGDTGSATEPLVDQVFDDDHVEGRSITGGYIYRGAAFPMLRGPSAPTNVRIIR